MKLPLLLTTLLLTASPSPGSLTKESLAPPG